MIDDEDDFGETLTISVITATERWSNDKEVLYHRRELYNELMSGAITTTFHGTIAMRLTIGKTVYLIRTAPHNPERRVYQRPVSVHCLKLPHER